MSLKKQIRKEFREAIRLVNPSQDLAQMNFLFSLAPLKKKP